LFSILLQQQQKPFFSYVNVLYVKREVSHLLLILNNLLLVQIYLV